MADEQTYEIVGVRSNVDRLNEESVRSLLKDFVYRTVHAAEDWLRLVVPKGESLRMERAIGTHGPDDEGLDISASVGIPPITTADVGREDPYFPGEQNSGDYPLFVDRGTGLFGPTHERITPRRGTVMSYDTLDGPMFSRSVAGQPGRHFMLDTYEQMTRVALPIERARFAERVQHLYADPIPTPSQ